ncbi:DUF4212 domain-containing protein [Methylibium sp.]|uniref:DUF4212 domain-containing protein n=1 Tax=Methylibium sp. TaxID=2067992 RepID=UPI00286C1005|nr:DUF4212 domain-containing protein [Methylibium sp.]
MSLYWRKTSRLTAVLLSIWFVTSFVLVYFARDLNFRFFGWPLSFYMAAQGSLAIYLLLVWLYARCMDRLDQEHGSAARH